MKDHIDESHSEIWAELRRIRDVLHAQATFITKHEFLTGEMERLRDQYDETLPKLTELTSQFKMLIQERDYDRQTEAKQRKQDETKFMWRVTLVVGIVTSIVTVGVAIATAVIHHV